MKRRELLEQVGRFRRQLAERDLLFGGASRALYDRLLAPARAQLGGRTALVIVPDDALWELPFQALQSPSGRYVLEEQAVSYTPSLSVARAVALMRRGRPLKPSSVPNLLAFGSLEGRARCPRLSVKSGRSGSFTGRLTVGFIRGTRRAKIASKPKPTATEFSTLPPTAY